MLGFLEYLIDSGRIARSRWWNKVDRSLVQGALSAWQDYDRHKPNWTDCRQSVCGWAYYIRGGIVNQTSVGGSWRQAWDAHQRALWVGVDYARVYKSEERYSERIFMWKVLNNVEFYARTGVDIDGALGVGIVLGRYPRNYPATVEQACEAVLATEEYAWFVERYFLPPSGWKNYCREHGGLRPIFVW